MKLSFLLTFSLVLTSAVACSRGKRSDKPTAQPAAASAPKSALAAPEAGSAGVCTDISGLYGCVDEESQESFDIEYTSSKDEAGQPRLMQSESESGISFLDIFSSQFIDSGLIADGQVRTEKGSVFGQSISLTYSVDCKGDDVSVHTTSKIEGDMANSSGTRVKISRQTDATLNVEAVTQDEGGREVVTKAVCTPKLRAEKGWLERLIGG